MDSVGFSLKTESIVQTGIWNCELETRTFWTSSILEAKGKDAKERNSKFGFRSFGLGCWRFELVANPRHVRLSSENPSESRRTLTETCTVTFLWLSHLSVTIGKLPLFMSYHSLLLHETIFCLLYIITLDSMTYFDNNSKMRSTMNMWCGKG